MSNLHADEVAKQQALSLAFCVAPTGKEQQAFVRLVNESEKEGNSPERVLIILLNSILDGLAYGNWP